jgi:hypothetical protein
METSKSWLDSLEYAKKEQESWERRAEKIVKRYRDDRSEMSNGKKYNILWSNVRTLVPAVYSKKPKAYCQRRNKDSDPVARCASTLLQRALQYEIDQFSDYDEALKHTVLDRMLVGRGTAWIRFQSDAGLEETDNEQEPLEVTDSTESNELCPTDYVFWKDFRHSPARTWDEVTWVARRVYLSRDEGVERFGDDFKQVPLSHEPIGLEKMKDNGANTDDMKKAVVWEIWDKSSKTALWVAVGYENILDQKDDPLTLEGFFPCPKPLFSTMTSDTLIPVPDYTLYQDQANELDDITGRIAKLVEAVKVVGVYDASQSGIQRMMQEGFDNQLIPVDTWAMFSEKGGLKGAVDFMPVEMVVNALNQLYTAREQVKQVIYEVTGISDILRGASVASETATAQNIKSQYASLRLKDMQSDVARFASDLLRMKAQVMAQFYKPETLVEMSGMMNTDDGKYLPQAIQLLKDNSLRAYRIEVETDSMITLDEQQEKQDRLEFLTATAGFLEKAIQAPPELTPLLGELLLFGVRSFKAGDQMEGAIENAVKQLTAPKPPQQQQPDPQMMAEQAKMQIEQAKMQMAQQAEQARAQMEQVKAQADSQLAFAKMEQEKEIEAAKMAHEQRMAELKQAHEMQLEQMKQQGEDGRTSAKLEVDSQTKIKVAEMSLEQKETPEVNVDGTEVEKLDPIKAMTDMHGEMMGQIGELAKVMAAPRTRKLVRGKDGKAESMIEVIGE